MKEFSVVFTKSKKKFAIGSTLIRLYTKKEYSHVARKLDVHNGQVTLYYQASEGKVNYESEEVFSHKHEIVKEYKFKICPVIYEKIGVECLKDAGKDYGYLQNLGIILVNLRICRDNPWKDGRNCSELIYLHVLKPMFPWLSFDSDTITPCEIECIILKNMHKDLDGLWVVNN